MEKFRKQIDIIDERIQELFLERMQIVKQVALYKKDNNLPVYDAVREEKIIKKNLESIEQLEIKALYETFYKKLLEVSKSYQERIIGD